MKPTLPILLLLCAAISAQGQTTDTTKRITLHELVTTAHKFPENRNNMAQQVQLINKKEIARIDPQTTAHMLEQTGSVFVPNILGGILTNGKLRADQVHPNAEGYKIIAERVYGKLERYL